MRIHIQGIPPLITEQQLIQRFQSFGDVSNVEVIPDPFDQSINRGFAYVTIDFDTDADQKKFFKTWNAGIKWGSTKPVLVQEAKQSYIEVMKERDLAELKPAQRRKPEWVPGIQRQEAEQKYWKLLKDGRQVRSMRIRDPVHKWKVFIIDPMKQPHKFFKGLYPSDSCPPSLQELYAQSPVQTLQSSLQNSDDIADRHCQDTVSNKADEFSEQQPANTPIFKRKVDLFQSQLIQTEQAKDITRLELTDEQALQMNDDQANMQSVLSSMFEQGATKQIEDDSPQVEHINTGTLKRHESVKISRTLHFDPSQFGIVVPPIRHIYRNITEPENEPLVDEFVANDTETAQPDIIESKVLKRSSYEIDLDQMQSLFQKKSKTDPNPQPFLLFGEEPVALEVTSNPVEQNDGMLVAFGQKKLLDDLEFSSLIDSVKTETMQKIQEVEPASALLQASAQQPEPAIQDNLAEMISRNSNSVNLFFAHIDAKDEAIRSRSVYHRIQSQLKSEVVTLEDMQQQWEQNRKMFTDDWKMRRKYALRLRRKLSVK